MQEKKVVALKKARLWVGVGYPENMVEDWQDSIGDLLQVPYCYGIHDKDKDKAGNPRKEHIHLIIAFSNTTTYNHALNVLNQLSQEGKTAFNACQAVIEPRHAYNYLIHDTEDSQKKGKYLYNPNSRISGNGFDIGDYEQLSIARKREITREMSEMIREYAFTNFMDFYEFLSNMPDDYFEVLETKSSYFERLIKGNYHRQQQRKVSGE